MPQGYLRGLTGTRRSESGNRRLVLYLASIAGATNAGGFFAVHQYTSHMSGIISAIANNLAIGGISLAAKGAASVLSFLMGAITTTLLIRWAKARSLESQYSLPLLLEALLLAIFGLIGKSSSRHVLGTILLLCFAMGLQNAMITKISGSVIRTTHLTGMLTDVGIALGRIAFSRINHLGATPPDRIALLRLLASLIFSFFAGGIAGAIGFRRIGFSFTLPLAALLIVLAAMPVLDDLRARPPQP